MPMQRFITDTERLRAEATLREVKAKFEEALRLWRRRGEKKHG